MSDMWEYGEAAESDGPARGPAGDVAFPWPPAEEDSVLVSFGETWKGATLQPGAFFARVPRDSGTGAAILYYLVIALLVAGATLFWNSLSLFAAPYEDSAMAMEVGMGVVSPLAMFFLTPVILLVMLLVATAITHVLLSLFSGSRHGFGTTVRVFSYAYSPGLFGVIPLIGGLVGSIWMIVLLIIGLGKAHETDGWKAAVAVLLPFALLMGLMMLAFVFMVAAAGSILATG